MQVCYPAGAGCGKHLGSLLAPPLSSQLEEPLAHARHLSGHHPLAGNPNVLVCERGTMFGYSDLIVDPRNFVAMRDAGCPVTADVTHALQQVTSEACASCTAGCGATCSGWLLLRS